jgi:cytoskeletal protein CcmA (bactofilin family)
MEETRVSRGERARLGTVQGDLRAEDHSVMEPSEGTRVVVVGRATFEGSVEVNCDFECNSLHSRDGLVRINGDLIVTEEVDVEDALYVRGNVKAKRIDVGGRFSAGGSLQAADTDVGGILEVQGGITGDSVDVGGSMDVRGEVKVKDLEAGGRVEVGGGEVAGTVDVGGTFRSSRHLKFDVIDTGGTVELAGGEGRRIDVGGRVTSQGDLKCDEVDVGGVVDVNGSLAGRSADVGGRIRVTGDLRLSEKLDVGGAAEIGGVISGKDVEVGGRLRASKGLLSGDVSVSGTVDAPQGLKAVTIRLGRGARCSGTLVGGTIHLGAHSQAEDIFCSRLEVEGGTRLGKVAAERAEFGDDCIVKEIVYTGEIRQGSRVLFMTPPQKSESLPPFPL